MTLLGGVSQKESKNYKEILLRNPDSYVSFEFCFSKIKASFICQNFTGRAFIIQSLCCENLADTESYIM
jgi:hypothetical protein